MRFQIVASPQAEHQVAMATALKAGFDRHSIRAEIVSGSSQVVPGTIVACWGWRNGSQHAGRGHRVLLMERGYCGDRFQWGSLCWDGLNGRGKFPDIEDGGVRWDDHFGDLAKPVDNARDGYALILGQVPGDASLMGMDPAGFYRLAQKLCARIGAEPRYRPHPIVLSRANLQSAPPTMHGMKTQGGTLEHALGGAAFVVAFNSNSLTDAALHGVPLIAWDKGAMAWDIAHHAVRERPRLDAAAREAWQHRLAWTQWLPHEVASGAAWEALSTAFDPEARPFSRLVPNHHPETTE